MSIDTISTLMDEVNDVIVNAADSPWIYVILMALCIIDGFFPPVPSETVVVALGATAVAAGVPNLWLVIFVAAAGAVIGDNIAYGFGRALGTTRFAWMQRPRAVKTFAWARNALDTRGGLLIMVARYVPVGRIAVNMTSGASGYPHRKFFTLTVIAGTSWSVYSAGIGALAGHWVDDNPILAVVVAVAFAMAVGLVADWIRYRVSNRRSAKLPE